MSSSTQRLDLLRRDIDAIDVALHDLIVKRATIVEDIGKIKNRAGPALHPGREASILRRLAARHQGRFPLPALICVWRELISTFTQMQESFSAAVYAPPGQDRLVALARNHYGSRTPLNPVPTASAAVRAVAERTVNVAILPLPDESESEAWWPLLMGSDEKTPRIITRLPFVFDGKSEQALVVGTAPRDLTDDEASLIAIELTERTSRGRVANEVTAAGFTGTVALASVDPGSGRTFHLVEVAGHVANDDARLKGLRDQLGEAFVRAHVIGGYASQIMLPAKQDP